MRIELIKQSILARVSRNADLSREFKTGDVAINSFIRARKFRKAKFKITSTESYQNEEGRILSTYLFGVDDNGIEVKINAKNCTLVRKSERRIRVEVLNELLSVIKTTKLCQQI